MYDGEKYFFISAWTYLPELLKNISNTVIFFNNDKGTRHTKWTQLLSRMMIVFRNIFKSFVFLYKHIHMTWVTYIFFLYTSLFLHEHICLSSWKTSNTVKFFIIMPKTQGIQNKHNFISRMMIVFRNRFGKHSYTFTFFFVEKN